MSDPAVVAVVGSCSTRDSFNSRFNPDYKRFFRVDASTNQSSVIALMSPPIETEFDYVRGESTKHKRWTVSSDLTREFLDLAPGTNPDHLILDFFGDLHFGLVRLGDGRYLTDNRWMVQNTDFYADVIASGTATRLNIFDDTEEYLALWREAIGRFAAWVAAELPDTTVIVHRGLNVDRVAVPGKAWTVPIRQHRKIAELDIPRANELWAVLDDHCLETFGWEQIDLRGEGYTSYADHPWGPFYVHYTMDYYHRFLAELLKIDLRRQGAAADLLARVAEIETAAAEHGEVRLAAKRRIAAAQQRRIAELESLGPLRAARFALGKRVRAARSRTTRGRV